MTVLAPDFAKFALRLNAIPDRPVGPLPLAPHPQQGRMAGVHEVDDPRLGLAGVFLLIGGRNAASTSSAFRGVHCYNQ